MDKNQIYLLNLHKQLDNEIEKLRPFAKANKVPIVDKLTLDMIKQLIRLHRPKHILEIGTAIAYSAMQFASVNEKIHVTTIERDEEMQRLSKQHVTQFGYDNQITFIQGDALEQFENVNMHSYDMIFIDAAKAQSKKFFELYSPLLNDQGMIITDNVLYHGFVADIEVVRSRNVKQMVKRVQQYNEWLMNHPDFSTNFLNIDDGLAISIKGESI